jgi:hypothetical protein
VEIGEAVSGEKVGGLTSFARRGFVPLHSFAPFELRCYSSNTSEQE